MVRRKYGVLRERMILDIRLVSPDRIKSGGSKGLGGIFRAG